MTNEQKIDRLRREISSKTQLRTQLEHHGTLVMAHSLVPTVGGCAALLNEVRTA